MKAYVTVDNNYSVSYKGNSLASIPRERKMMLDEIRGKTVVYDIFFVKELPGQQPVRDAENYIYTCGRHETVKGARCFETIGELRAALAKENMSEVYIIHGADLYNAFYPEIDTFHVTKIDYEYNADASIPDLEKDESLEVTATSDEMYCFDMIYEFIKYERR